MLVTLHIHFPERILDLKGLAWLLFWVVHFVILAVSWSMFFLPIGSTVVVKCENRGPWIHGTIVQHRSEDHNGRCYKIWVMKIAARNIMIVKWHSLLTTAHTIFNIHECSLGWLTGKLSVFFLLGECYFGCLNCFSTVFYVKKNPEYFWWKCILKNV